MEKKMILREYGHKFLVCIFICLLLLVSYFFIEKILPLVWPFVVAIIIASVIKPVISFFNKKLHLPKGLATFLVLLIVSVVIIYGGTKLTKALIEQVKMFAANYDIYIEKVDVYICDACISIGDYVGYDGNELYKYVCAGVSKYMDEFDEKFVSKVMGNSVSMFVVAVEVIAGVAITVAITIAGIFLYASRQSEIREYVEKSYFGREISFLVSRIKEVGRVYFRAQAVIMLVVCVECVLGLILVQNKYALILGILIGLLDALPLIGVGAVFIPWTIICLFMGNYLNAAIIFTLFIVCYFTREFLEPRFIGERMGINPFVSLMILYVGFKLFGVLGMFMAPVVFVIVKDGTKHFIEFIKS